MDNNTQTKPMPWAGESKAKRCVHCGEVKLNEDFNKNSAAKDGLQSWCRDCQKEASKARHARAKQQGKRKRKKRSPAKPFDGGWVVLETTLTEEGELIQKGERRITVDEAFSHLD